MIHRISKLSKSRSFFLFGARGTGKSTLLNQWKKGKSVQIYNLLDPETEAILRARPSTLLENWKAEKTDWIVIDEIQKNIQLLDVVHDLIVKHKINFALTGSSARKLKRGSANMLGGRADQFNLFPFSALELNKKFNLNYALSYGTLPVLYNLEKTDLERALYSYVSIYLKEEILVEQIIRDIEPFRKFLAVAAQMSGQILNYSKISRDCGVEEKSIARYYQILEDTLLGFYLEPYSASVRKQQTQKSKFYLFDCGVTRALQNTLKIPLSEQTTGYGKLFEQFVILEFIKLNEYYETHFKFSYLKTNNQLELDLIIERPGQKIILIEIKSSTQNRLEDADSLNKLKTEFKNPVCYVLNTSLKSTEIDGVLFTHWQKGLTAIFGPVDHAR